MIQRLLVSLFSLDSRSALVIVCRERIVRGSCVVSSKSNAGWSGAGKPSPSMSRPLAHGRKGLCAHGRERAVTAGEPNEDITKDF